MTATPISQADIWNGNAGNAWVDLRGLLDEMFRPIEALLAQAVESGQRVLDVGCGTGGTTRATPSNRSCMATGCCSPPRAGGYVRRPERRLAATARKAAGRPRTGVRGSLDGRYPDVHANFVKSGFRFSKNAVNASFASAPCSISKNSLLSSAMIASSCALREDVISRLVVRIEAAGSATSLAACARACSSTSAAGSTFDTMPMS
jgi:SAM-dependent methyltransferase